MKICIVGCGAVGGYYGAMLSRAGQEVRLLLRSDYDIVRRSGVHIQSPSGNFVVHPHCADAPEQIGPCQVVFIALKTTANAEFARLLPPLVGPRTAIVTLQNGLGNEEQLARIFPAEQILGGLCFVCLNRVSPGVINHLDHGLIVLGEYQRPPESRTYEIAAMFRQAGVPCRVSDNLACAHWEKLIWNVPFNGLGVASAAGAEALDAQLSNLNSQLQPCLTTDRLLADTRWEQLVRELMQEVITTANTLGLGVSESLGEQQIERTRTMGPYKASTLLDFELGRPLELESLFLEPLRQARKAGVATPRLEALCQVLRQLDSRRLSKLE
jgi:2-dehydropantoate 2-reductase